MGINTEEEMSLKRAIGLMLNFAAENTNYRNWPDEITKAYRICSAHVQHFNWQAFEEFLLKEKQNG